MNDTYLTIIGNVVAPPRMRMTKSGFAVTNFRVASTSRRFDTEKGQFVDNDTLFVNVTCWRAMAENVAESLQKGQPVIVTGRYYSREYEVEETKRMSFELEAIAVGHDLSRGTTAFRRVIRPTSTGHVPVDAEGLPVDDSDRWLDVATGEVSELNAERGSDDPAAELATAS
jgi:single-strand DNA-binding protein